MRFLKKYLYLYWAFFRASIAADIEYRANFISRIVTDIFWYAAQIGVFEVIYKQTSTLGTWTVGHMRIFLGILFVSDALFMVLFSDNVENFSDKIRRGDLDLALAKPVNSQFLLSTQRAATACLGNLLIAGIWLAWSIHHFESHFSLLRLLWLIILIPSGVIISYCGRFTFCIASILFTNAQNLQYLWYQLYRLGMRPDIIYQPWLKYAVLTLFPVGMIASVPARALLEEPNLPLFFWAIFVSGLCLYGTHRFWNYSIRHYGSASS
jgi:ABC-2 type transport system permease protein